MISIVITTYDSDRLGDVSDLLESLRLQSCQDFEIIYVTERDERLSSRVSNLLKSKGINGFVIHNDGPWGLSESRNIGVMHSNGGIIAFLDDDVLVKKDWVQSVVDAFKFGPDVIGVTGPAYPLWIGCPLDWFPPELDWLIGCTRWYHSKSVRKVRNGWGMNMAFTRDAFDKAGLFSVETGYHRGPIAEDVEFSMRVRRETGKAIYYIPDMAVFNKVYPYRTNPRFILARSSWIGYTRRAIRRLENTSERADFSMPLTVIMALVGLSPSSRGPGTLRRTKLTLLVLFSLGLGFVFGPLG